MIRLSQLFPTVVAALSTVAVVAAPALAGPSGGGAICNVGIYTAGDEFLLDQNNNGIWDGAATDARFRIAQTLNQGVPVHGNWNGDVNGVEGMGKFVASTGTFALDINADNSWGGAAGGDRASQFVGTVAGGEPVIGVWGSLTNDAVGRYVSDEFWLDMNGNGYWDGVATDARFKLAAAVVGGVAIAGNFDSDPATTEVGRYIAATSQFIIDKNGNHVWDGAPTDVNSVFAAAAVPGGVGVPIVGNFNPATATDEIGVYNPTSGLAYLDYNGNFVWDGAGTDRLVNLAQVITNSTYHACSFTGTGDQIAKYQASSSTFVVDLNGNFTWDGVAGGDRLGAFAAAAAGGTATPVFRKIVVP